MTQTEIQQSKIFGRYKFDDPNRNTTIKNIWEIQIHSCYSSNVKHD